MNPDDGSLVQPKHVAFRITKIKCCVQTGCFIVKYCSNTAGMTNYDCTEYMIGLGARGGAVG